MICIAFYLSFLRRNEKRAGINPALFLCFNYFVGYNIAYNFALECSGYAHILIQPIVLVAPDHIVIIIRIYDKGVILNVFDITIY